MVIDTQRDNGISVRSPHNLLDTQIMESVKGCIENIKINNIELLQHLQKIENDGIPRDTYWQDKIFGLELERNELKSLVVELNDEIDKMADGHITIETHRDSNGVRVNTSNLLDEQLVEAFKECLENSKINHIKFCRHLEQISKTGEIL